MKIESLRKGTYKHDGAIPERVQSSEGDSSHRSTPEAIPVSSFFLHSHKMAEWEAAHLLHITLGGK